MGISKRGGKEKWLIYKVSAVPNHRVKLVECHGGVGTCPISGCKFTYEANEGDKKRKLRLNALGEVEEVTDYKVVQVGGGKGG